jgi:hypothetical protein
MNTAARIIARELIETAAFSRTDCRERESIAGGAETPEYPQGLT